MVFSFRAVISEKRVQRSQTQTIGGRETQPRWGGTCCSGQPRTGTWIWRSMFPDKVCPMCASPGWPRPRGRRILGFWEEVGIGLLLPFYLFESRRLRGSRRGNTGQGSREELPSLRSRRWNSLSDRLFSVPVSLLSCLPWGDSLPTSSFQLWSRELALVPKR